jgi:PTS system ascorbate-specific IIA component
MYRALAEAFGPHSIRVGAVPLDRSHAISMAGDLLVASGRVTPEYVEEMVQAVEDHGPYIVIAPGIALAHGRPSPVVIETGLSLVTLAMPVNFGSHNDPVRLVFGLSAFDHTSHLDTMKSLAELLGNEQFVNMLLNAQEESQIRQYFE